MEKQAIEDGRLRQESLDAAEKPIRNLHYNHRRRRMESWLWENRFALMTTAERCIALEAERDALCERCENLCNTLALVAHTWGHAFGATEVALLELEVAEARAALDAEKEAPE